MKTFASLAILALLGEVDCYKLQQQNRLRNRAQLGVRMRYENSEGPTMPDNGENDSGVMGREDDDSKTAGGWSNPLSWTDDGTDDQFVVNMEFKSLDAPYSEYEARDWTYDENIIDSFESEKDASKTIAKSKKKWAEEAEKQQQEYEDLQAEMAGKGKKKQDKGSDEGKNKSNKGNKGDGDSTPTKKAAAKAADDKKAGDSAGEADQAGAKGGKEGEDSKVIAPEDAAKGAENAEMIKTEKKQKEDKKTEAKAEAKAAPKPAAKPAAGGGPDELFGGPTKSESKVQTGHFKIMLDNEEMDVDSNEFDNDQSLIQQRRSADDYDTSYDAEPLMDDEDN